MFQILIIERKTCFLEKHAFFKNQDMKETNKRPIGPEVLT